MPTHHLDSPRLRVVASTADVARAAIAGGASLAGALGVMVPAEWPPEALADVQEFFAGQLAANPGEVGWWGWYVIAKPGVVSPEATLIGSAGASLPDAEGRSLGGYSILPAYEGRGFATEAARAVFECIAAHPAVRSLEATTFERNVASRRVLEKIGFRLVGVSAEDAAASEFDRKGRGKLLLYRRPG